VGISCNRQTRIITGAKSRRAPCPAESASSASLRAWVERSRTAGGQAGVATSAPITRRCEYRLLLSPFLPVAAEPRTSREFAATVSLMARPRYPKSSGPLPPALPPVARTVGQLVAETLKLYGRHFFRVLPLGLVVALADQASLGQDVPGRIVVLLLAAPFFSAAYADAAALSVGGRPSTRVWLTAIGVGTLVFLPAAFLFPWFALAAVAILALFGHSVPAAVVEQVGPAAALRRSVVVARADLVHAIGGLATLVIMFGLTRLMMGFVLRSQADNTLRVSIFLADVVLGPILFLGAALLYADLAARVGTTREERRAMRLTPPHAAQ
jgi:hypothetical protein